MKIYFILALVLSLVGSGIGLVHYIKKSGALELENSILTAQQKDMEEQAETLGVAYAELNVKYYELEKNSHEEINKFEHANLDEIPVDDFIGDWNDGSDRVLKDFERQTEQFYLKANKATDSKAGSVTKNTEVESSKDK